MDTDLTTVEDKGTAKAVATTPLYSEDDLANLNSFEDVLALLADAGVEITDASDYGDGFAVMDKDMFVNVPFIIIDWKFADGDYGSDFAILRIMTLDGRKAIITDGSAKSGIRPQVKDYERRGSRGGIRAKGLTRSDYTYVDDKGVEKPASTYYISQ